MPDILGENEPSEYRITTTTVTFATAHSSRIRFKKLGNEAVRQKIDKFRKWQDTRMLPQRWGLVDKRGYS